MATALAVLGAACGLLIATLLSRDPREAIAYVVACLMIGGAVAVGRRGATAADPLETSRREMRAVAHDLRAPLLTVSSYIDLVVDGAFGPLTPETSTALRQASSVTFRAQALVESLLQGVTTTPPAASVTRVDLEDMMSEVFNALTTPMRERHASVSMEGRMPVVRGEETALFRVFENLLQNSIKFTRPCDLPRISLHTRRLEGGLVEVAVRDNGIGFHPNESQDILAPGARGEAVAGVSGYGLGLATVSQLLTARGGTITIDPPSGHGSTVRVTLREG